MRAVSSLVASFCLSIQPEKLSGELLSGIPMVLRLEPEIGKCSIMQSFDFFGFAGKACVILYFVGYHVLIELL